MFAKFRTGIIVACTAAIITISIPFTSIADPGFDLDLKEFRRPSSPINHLHKPSQSKKDKTVKPAVKTTQQKSKPAPKEVKKEAVSAAKPAKVSTAVKPSIKPVPPPASTPAKAAPVAVKNVPIPVPVPVIKKIELPAKTGAERITVLNAATACALADKLMVLLAEKTTAEELFPGIIMPAGTTAARYDGASAILACEMPKTDEYTFRRLLELKDIQLISLSKDDSPQNAVYGVAEALGISFQLISAADQIYQFRINDKKDVLLKMGSFAD